MEWKKLGKAKCQEGSRVCSSQENKGEKTSSKEPETNSTREKGQGAQKTQRRITREADHAVVSSGWLERRTMPLFSDAGWRSVHGCCLTGEVDYADDSYV